MQIGAATVQAGPRVAKNWSAAKGLSVTILGQTGTVLDILNRAPCNRFSTLSVLLPQSKAHVTDFIAAVKPDILVIEDSELSRLHEYLQDSQGASLGKPVVCICGDTSDRLGASRVASVTEYTTITSPSSAIDTLEVVANHGRFGPRDQYYRALVVGPHSPERSRLVRELVNHTFPAIPVVAPTIDLARRWLGRHRFDVMVIVKDGEDQSGFEHIDFISEHQDALPIVALLDTNSLPTVNRFYRAGCTDVLVGEEIVSDELVGNAVRRGVGLFRQVRQNYSIDTRDVLERLEAEQMSLVAAARSDSMTGLPNRDVFDEALADFCYRAEDGACSFAAGIVDLDEFKGINDTYGHPAGDDALRVVADMMREVLPASALSCRIGGDEFAFLCEGITCDESIRYAEKLCSRMASADANGTKLSISVGLSFVHSGTKCTPRSVLSSADAGLYASKGGGRDRVTYNSHAAAAID